MLLLSKVRNLGNFREQIGSGSPPSHVMSLSQSEAQNREGICSRGGIHSQNSCDVSEPIREPHDLGNGSGVDPLSGADPLSDSKAD